MPQWLWQGIYSECNLRMVRERKGIWRLCPTRLAGGATRDGIYYQHSPSIHWHGCCLCCQFNLWLHYITLHRKSSGGNNCYTSHRLHICVLFVLVLCPSHSCNLPLWSLGFSTMQLGSFDHTGHFPGACCKFLWWLHHHHSGLCPQYLVRSGLVSLHCVARCGADSSETLGGISQNGPDVEEGGCRFGWTRWQMPINSMKFQIPIVAQKGCWNALHRCIASTWTPAVIQTYDVPGCEIFTEGVTPHDSRKMRGKTWCIFIIFVLL